MATIHLVCWSLDFSPFLSLFPWQWFDAWSIVVYSELVGAPVLVGVKAVVQEVLLWREQESGSHLIFCKTQPATAIQLAALAAQLRP